MIQSIVTRELLTESLSQEGIFKLNSNSTITTYEKNQVIFYEGSMPFGIYIILSGKIMLYKTGDLGKKQIFQLAKTGDIFGFHAVLTDEPYPDSAATLEKCEIQFIPKHFFIDCIQKSNKLCFAFAKALSCEFRQFVDFETMLAQKPVRERVAYILSFLHDFYLGKNKVAVIPLNRNDLADLCGTVKETLVRVLKEFKTTNCVRSVGVRDLEIIDLEKLKTIAAY